MENTDIELKFSGLVIQGDRVTIKKDACIFAKWVEDGQKFEQKVSIPEFLGIKIKNTK